MNANDETKLTAYALGELDGDEARAMEELLARDAAARAEVEALRGFAAELERGLASESGLELTAAQRARIEGRARRRPRLEWALRIAVAAAIVGPFLWLLRPLVLQKLATREPSLNASIHSKPEAWEGSIKALSGLGYNGGGSTDNASTQYRDYTWRDSTTLSTRTAGGPVGDSGGDLASIGYSESDLDEPLLEHANTETYDPVDENEFVRVADDPRSTFAIDVDTASYSNVRRYLVRERRLPPRDAVRIEELVNYFPYVYAAPEAGRPFSVDVEVAAAPWEPAHRLVRVGLAGRATSAAERRDANLVFLIDVSGSMDSPDKLPLLVEGLSMLVRRLHPSDRVALVVYAGSSGLVLDSTACERKPVILEALSRLQAGGSTNGGDGIRLAYRVATEHFVTGGVNRVILATDGDFNVGTTSRGDLLRLIREQARSGVFLTVLGFGSGNLQDSDLEQLADEGNGQYVYVDSRHEARKALVEQLGGTLVTIAQDVKIQLEFNPAEVEAWRLIGYENRLLAHRDFDDDTKDAGEIGAGHTVTALYEVVPAARGARTSGDGLRYQRPGEPTAHALSGELLTVRLRYQPPGGGRSELLEVPVRDRGARFDEASEEFRFAVAVAAFGMRLRGSEHARGFGYAEIERVAREAQGPDPGGYRAEFLELAARAGRLAGE